MKNSNPNQRSNQFVTIFIAGILLGALTYFLFMNAGDLGSSISNPFPSLAKTTSSIEEVVVNRVVDGDTIELRDGRKIRLLNIDTPETVKPNTPVMCYGKEAKARMVELVDKKTVWLTYDKEKQDKYGRTLAFIYTERDSASNQKVEASANFLMIKSGLARAVFYPPNTTYKREFTSINQLAVDQKAGIWKACPKPFEL
jgi:micrococcal nuclease